MATMWNLTCNSTLEDMRILDGSEIQIVGPLTFHDLAQIIAAASTLVAVTMSLFLIWMHALHYTKPREQKHIIRILFMVPVYAASSLLSLRFYWHAIYFQVMSDCYEAFAISSFFALMCHYVAPDLHGQKEFFRNMRPVKRWVWPVNWFGACCCGQRGPWRTPVSGLTWFNIIWVGVYHYVFIRVAMTVTAVATQFFHRYCESSNSPVFAHIWVLAIVCVAVGIAMYCLIQFYVQLRVPLAEHRPFLKICAIKLVVFLSFWQSAAISVGTSQLQVVKPNDVFAYPDLKVGIPSLLLCFEMALFSIMHLWAFPYGPYRPGARPTFYPSPDPNSSRPPVENVHSPPQGGFLGLYAIWDALNLWDVVKAFGRGIRWLFVGVRSRHGDASYWGGGAMARKGSNASSSQDLDLGDVGRKGGRRGFLGRNSTEHLPIANQFRRSKFLGTSIVFDAASPTTTTTTTLVDGAASPANNKTAAATTMVMALATAAASEKVGGPPGSVSTTVRTAAVLAEPPPASPGFQRQESASLIAYAQSPGTGGRSGGQASSPYAQQPPSPYHDEVESPVPHHDDSGLEDDRRAHPGVAVPYPGHDPEPRRQQQQQHQYGPGPYRPQKFSRGPAPPPSAAGRPLWGPTQVRDVPRYQGQQRQQQYNLRGGDGPDGGMI